MEGWQRAFVLHSRPWSETSLMLDVFTEESGRVASGCQRRTL
ncbi:DNA repair protein [Escherichia coli]|nr:DNA repair protein [Escherichia coli]